MNEKYLTVMITLAGIIELIEYFKQNDSLKRKITLIISGCYFGECLCYNIVEDDFVSTCGCAFCGCLLIICLISRAWLKKR